MTFIHTTENMGLAETSHICTKLQQSIDPNQARETYTLKLHTVVTFACSSQAIYNNDV